MGLIAKRFASDLNTPLLKLTAQVSLTLRDACAGVHIFGAPGSGKTSGSGKAISAAYLRAGMGGIVICVKPEEVELWMQGARANGRQKSVILFDDSQGFNFIEYELARHGLAGISNVIECLMRILESADQATGSGGTSSDPFWAQSTRQLLNYVIPVLYAAHGQVTVPSIIDFVTSAATRGEQYRDTDWCESSYAARALRKSAELPVVPIDRDGIERLLRYWMVEYPAIPEKTRGNIVISLSAKLDRFRHGRLAQAFCGKTTVVPEMTFHGAIIILNMPILTWNEDGIIGQQLFKFMWQRAVESRNGLARQHRECPVFMWADESQYVVSVRDDEFLSTCRGSRACIVFLSQNLPSYYARLGKNNTDAADGLVGKFATQIFHQNACHRTNTFASHLIGRAIQLRRNSSHNTGRSWSEGVSQGEGSNSSYGSGGGFSAGGGNRSWNSGSGTNTSWSQNIGSGTSEGASSGVSEQMDFIVEPNYFASRLLSGGKQHRYIVTGLWFKAGANFGGGGNIMLAAFKQ